MKGKLVTVAASVLVALSLALVSSPAHSNSWPDPVHICEGAWCEVFEWLWDHINGEWYVQYSYSYPNPHWNPGENQEN